jgi:hypothetical protein
MIRSSLSCHKSFQSSLRDVKQMQEKRQRPRSRRASIEEAEWSSAFSSDQLSPSTTCLCTSQEERPWRQMEARRTDKLTDFQHTRTRSTSVAGPTRKTHPATSLSTNLQSMDTSCGQARRTRPWHHHTGTKLCSTQESALACTVGLFLVMHVTMCSAFSPTCCAGRVRAPAPWIHRQEAAIQVPWLLQDATHAAKRKTSVFMNLCHSAYADGNDSNRPHLFLSGLPRGLDEDGLKRLLLPFGDVSWAKLVLDVNTGISKSNAFARFRAWDMALKALSGLDGTEVCTIGDDDGENSCSVVRVEAASDKSQAVMSERLSSKLEDMKRQIELEKREGFFEDDSPQTALTYKHPNGFGGSLAKLFYRDNHEETFSAVLSPSSNLLIPQTSIETKASLLVKSGLVRRQKRFAQRGQVFRDENKYQQHSLLSRRLVGRVGLVSSVGHSFCIVNQDIFCSRKLFPKDRALSIGDLVSVDATWRVRGQNKWVATKLELHSRSKQESAISPPRFDQPHSRAPAIGRDHFQALLECGRAEAVPYRSAGDVVN